MKVEKQHDHCLIDNRCMTEEVAETLSHVDETVFLEKPRNYKKKEDIPILSPVDDFGFLREN